MVAENVFERRPVLESHRERGLRFNCALFVVTVRARHHFDDVKFEEFFGYQPNSKYSERWYTRRNSDQLSYFGSPSHFNALISCK